MTLPSFWFAARWLMRDTVSQARAVGLIWALCAVTGVCVLFCLSVSISGDAPWLPVGPGEEPHMIPAAQAKKMRLDPDTARTEGVDVVTGEMSLGFGAVRVPLARTRVEAVRFLQVILAGGVAGAGVLLALVWTAGFLPSFLDPAAASVLLAKPSSRWGVLVGKVAGVTLAVAGSALVFVATTWLALGARTSVWDGRYFLAVPLIVIHFLAFFSISALFAVYTRSAVAAALAALFIWAVCAGVNITRHELVVRHGSPTPRPAVWALEAGYWLLPKPADYNLLLTDALGAEQFFYKADEYKALQTRGEFRGEWSVLTAIVFPVAMLVLAGRALARTDY